eukprot:6368731-Prymnesium_polylepis.1
MRLERRSIYTIHQRCKIRESVSFTACMYCAARSERARPRRGAEATEGARGAESSRQAAWRAEPPPRRASPGSSGLD